MTELLAACKKAFGTEGSRFTLVGERGELPLTRKDFHQHAGHRVIWPLESNAASISHFISALLDGVKPILISAKTPPEKLKKLQARFSAGIYQQGEIFQTDALLHDGHDSFLYVLTSGSTGQPKAVAASEARLAGMLRAIHMSQHLETVNSVLACLPLGFSSGLINQLLWALYKGRSLHLPDNVISPITLLSTADQLGSEMLCFVNTQIKMIASLYNSDETAPLEKVKVVNFSGEFFPGSHYALLKTLFPNARLYNNYGCTEAMPRISVRDVTLASHALNENVGSCIDGTTLRIESNQPAGPLEFRSHWSAIGYLNERGDMTCFGEWIASGDAGRIINGELHLSGRCDQLVKLGGERYSLREVELAATKAGFQGAIAILEGDKVTLIIHATHTDHSDKIRTLRSLISPMLRPRQIYRRDDWPLLANGKVDRQQIALHCRERTDHQEKIWPDY